MSENETPQRTPEEERELRRLVRVITHLDAAERLALWIVANIGMSHYLNREEVTRANDDGINALWLDVTKAIREALPMLDMVELQQIHDGIMQEVRERNEQRRQ